MRITYLLPDPGIPVGGTKGASVHVAEVTRAMAAAGAQVQLLAMRADERITAEPGVELRVFDAGSIPKGPAGDSVRLLAVRAFLAWAEDQARGFAPDLVYERLSLFAGGGGQLARRLGAPRIVEVNAPVAAERAAHGGVALVARAEQAEREALGGARVVAVSSALEAWCRSRGAIDVEVIPNGVDVARFDPARHLDEAAAIRHQLDLEGAEVVGFVGSMKPWHGVSTLLDAAALLAARRPGLRVLLVGDGPAMAEARARADQPDLAGRCRFTGAVTMASIPGHLAALDVAVAPYHAPGTGEDFYFSPLKVVEAMAAGRPVVASRFAPIETMLGGTGRLVGAGDARQLAAAIGALLDDRLTATALGQRARARAVSRLGWDSVVARILASAQAQPDANLAAVAGA